MDAQLLAFVILAAVLTVTPGADMALVARNAVSRGQRAAWYTTLGIALGCVVHAVASSLGLSVLLATSATAFHGVKIVGAAYLAWLGITTLLRSFRSSEDGASENMSLPGATQPVIRTRSVRMDFSRDSTSAQAEVRGSQDSRIGSNEAGGNSEFDGRSQRLRKSFVEGLLTNLLNPKVALFYLMLLPQFIAPGQNVLVRSLMLAGLHIGMGVAWLTMYAAAIDQLRGVLTRPRVRQWFDRAMGTCLMLLGLRLAVEKLDRR